MKLSWIVQFSVDSSWVKDGFDLTNDRASLMISEALPSAIGSEIKAKVLSAPDSTKIAKLQGYKGASLKEGISLVNKARGKK